MKKGKSEKMRENKWKSVRQKKWKKWKSEEKKWKKMKKKNMKKWNNALIGQLVLAVYFEKYLGRPAHTWNKQKNI